MHNRVSRRSFLLGAATVAGTALTGCTPGGPAAAITATDQGATVEPMTGIEKPKLRIGFIPITCASPIINAVPLGFYAKHGLEVELVKYPGWADIRDAYIAGQIDASHLLSPIPLAVNEGFGSTKVASRLAVMGNVNGQAITISNDKRVTGPEDLKGLRLAVPFQYSMHNFLLRHYLTTGGLDPDKDVTISVMRPPDMVANLISKNIDGYLGPDPFNQRAVAEGAGYLHALTRDFWDGHPCCGFAVQDSFATQNPVTYRALLRAITDAAAWSDETGNRTEAATSMAPEQYLNQKPELLTAILTGSYEDGLGAKKAVPDRIAFEPYPWQSFGVWMLTQMQRWDLAPKDAYATPADYLAAAARVFDTTAAAQAMKDLGQTVPTGVVKPEMILGTAFDAAQPAAWTKTFL